MRATWFFEGKIGINPKAEVVHTITRRADRVVVRFRLAKGVFGLAAFFGEYVIEPLSTDSCRFAERVYIDSGMFINASKAEIEEGLREDLKRLRAWLGLADSESPKEY